MQVDREGHTRRIPLRYKILVALALTIALAIFAYRLANILSGFVLQDTIMEEAPWLGLLLLVSPGLILFVLGAFLLPDAIAWLVRWLSGPSPMGRAGGQDSCAPQEPNDTPGDPKAGQNV